MESFLPKDLANIVYNYEIQLRQSDVLDNLKNMYQQNHKECSYCNNKEFSFVWIPCDMKDEGCSNCICKHCYKNEQNNMIHYNYTELLCSECDFIEENMSIDGTLTDIGETLSDG